jgi:hypothetical protein
MGWAWPQSRVYQRRKRRKRKNLTEEIHLPANGLHNLLGNHHAHHQQHHSDKRLHRLLQRQKFPVGLLKEFVKIWNFLQNKNFNGK